MSIYILESTKVFAEARKPSIFIFIHVYCFFIKWNVIYNERFLGGHTSIAPTPQNSCSFSFRLSTYLSANLCGTFSKCMRGEEAKYKNITYTDFNICPDDKYSFWWLLNGIYSLTDQTVVLVWLSTSNFL